VTIALAVVWGALAAAPVAARARRRQVASHARALRAGPAPRPLRVPWSTPAPLRGALAVIRAPVRTRARRHRDDQLARELATAVDLVGVGVGAGLTPYLAIRDASEWSPPMMASAFRRVTRACTLGQSFDDALRELGSSVPGVRVLTDALRTSTRLGTPVAPALARVATDVRTDLRRRAETRARTVPVRLCFPLVGCILPAFALLTVVPVVLDGLRL
jgi:Flp pilus assembly protein TadB